MSEEPNIRRSTRAPRPSTLYDPTHWEIGSLATQKTTRSAASIRRRRHLCEELESSHRHEQLIAIAAQVQIITARLEVHRKSDAIRRALRHEQNLADNDALSSRSRSHPNNAIPAWIEQQPQPTTTHVSADLPPHSPTPASARDQPETENETGPEPKQEKKAAGIDGLPNSLLKVAAPAICFSLAALFNNSLLAGKLPRDWKRANVRAIYKRGPKHLPDNCRSLYCHQSRKCWSLW